jgi:hypothetical protein
MRYTSASTRNPTQILTREPDTRHSPPPKRREFAASRTDRSETEVRGSGGDEQRSRGERPYLGQEPWSRRSVDGSLLHSPPVQRAGDKDDGADEGEERAGPRRR